MDRISDIVIKPLANSPYIKPSRIHYKQNGKEKIWDAMKVHDGVAILIYNTTRNAFVFVKQFGPAIYITSVEIIQNAENEPTVDTNKYPGSLGITYELCAGIVDKKTSLEEISRLEVLEECGYDVPVESLEKVTSFKSGVGTTGALLTLFYVEVTDQQKVSAGGGNPEEGELIEVVDVPVSEAQTYALDESINRPATFSMSLLWFEKFKKHLHQQNK